MAESNMDFAALMNDEHGAIAGTMASAREYLGGGDPSRLLSDVGHTIDSVPVAEFPDKRWFQKSYGRAVTDKPEDLLVGRGLFYLTEQRQLFLDCTGGHYQMIWGYEQPELTAALLDGIQRGIIWDNHSNIPSAPVKRLAGRLVEVANPGADLTALQEDDERLNTVLTGCATGTVACGAGMKMQLLHYEQNKSACGVPVFVTMDGNYHGSDIFAQRLRGMWPQYFTNLEVVMVQPNDGEELERVFGEYGERIAGFWAEPVLMNREAILLEPEYLQLARRLCDATGALMAMDEIQTCFWFPEIMMFHRFDIVPDLVILGKGMTAGFHPLAAVVYKGKYDVLAQYDAVSTNGNAALPAYLALANIALVRRDGDRIASAGEYYHGKMTELAGQFSDVLVGARGIGHMTGLKFQRVEDAMAFHRAAVAGGLWLRVHAYHEGHSTILTKFALPLDERVADYAVGRYAELLGAL